MRRKLLSILALLCLTVSSAWAQEETLLTTILSTSNTDFEGGSKTFDNIATVTFSGFAYNDGDEWGWCSYSENTLTVTAAEGYTITRVKFYTNSGSGFDEEAPFEAILDGNDITKVNGTSIGSYGYGVTKIEVYGYAGTPAPTVVASGNCGTSGHESDVTWSLTDDGTLTISGTGAMENYTAANKQPWYSSVSSITSVVVGEGVTRIGNSSFRDFTNMTSVSLPDGLETIGAHAFNGCTNTSFTSITIPASVTSIGEYNQEIKGKTNVEIIPVSA